MQVQTTIDGQVVGRSAHRAKTTGGSFRGIEEVPGQFRRLMFAPLVLTGAVTAHGLLDRVDAEFACVDDDSVLASSNAIHPDLGTIEVSMRHVDHFTVNNTRYSSSKFNEIGPIHERSKKGGAHAVS